ncbi:hypothetical protein F5Y16DRAFT_373612 [Xylariaceae sp. FL0255]|nr:hypothetical protein F5Y16DRAFT_373612 [Xylariaceae sp. FL0255]
MDEPNNVVRLATFNAAHATPIAQLSPDLPDPHSKAVHGLVTITWPYNSVKGTFAFNLAEPDFRKRRNKGQVRITFTGRAAKVAGECGLAGNDKVLLSLDGAAWEPEDVDRRQSLPGSELGWKIVFADNFSLKISRADNDNESVVTLAKAPIPHVHPEPIPDLSSTLPSTPYKHPTPPVIASPPPPTSRISLAQDPIPKKLNDGEFASPAFIKRARMSYGSLFEDGLDIFEEDGGVRGKGRKRTRFGRESGAWRFSSQSPSPEPPAVQFDDLDDYESDKKTSPPPQIETTDEGCQTMELDDPAIESVETTTEVQDAQPISPEHSTASQENELGQHETPTIQDSPSAPVVAADPPPMPMTSSETWSPIFPVSASGPMADNESLHSNVTASSHHTDLEVEPQVGHFRSELGTTSVTQSIFESPLVAPPVPVHPAQPFSSSILEITTIGALPLPLDEPAQPELNPVSFSHHAGVAEEAAEETGPQFIQPNADMDTYPPLSGLDHMGAPSVHDEALTNYPSNYLDEGNMPQEVNLSMNMSSSIPNETPPATSWATVNNNTEATAMPVGTQFASSDGSTPDQALVIDDSDSDEDSTPAPAAVVDTHDRGRTDALDMYQDAEVEDESDAQYADEDEVEYDGDEMGGDYDTRNYEHPDDDEDDIDDEDLRPRRLEPEFDDGESWDEDEEEEDIEEQEFDDEDIEEEFVKNEEDEYDGHDFQNPTQTAPAVQPAPMVIDLISSSDESGDEDDDADGDADMMIDVQPPSTAFLARSSIGHQPMATRGEFPEDELDERHNGNIQSHNLESDYDSDVSKDSDRMSAQAEAEYGYEEDEDEEDEDEVDDNGEEESIEEGIPRAPTPEAPEDEGEQLAKRDPQPAISEATHGPVDEIRSEQSPLDPKDSHESIDTPEDIMGMSRSSFTPIPTSAADGLEMLSRALESETHNSRHIGSAQVIEQQVNIEGHTSPQLQTEESGTAVLTAQLSDVIRKLSDTADHDEDDQVSLIVPTTAPTEHHLPFTNKMTTSAVAPSSPPLTQSFRSLAHETLISTSQNSSFNPETTLLLDQLPTPLETQVTDSLEPKSTIEATPVDVEHSFEHEMPYAEEEPKPPANSNDINQQAIITMDFGPSHVERPDASGSTEYQEPAPTRQLEVASPARSFKSQLDEDLGHLESSEKPRHDVDEAHPIVSLDGSTDGTGAIQLFQSNMDVDDELQASILENSQSISDDDDNGHGQLSSSIDKETAPDAPSDLELEQEKNVEILSSPSRAISAQLQNNFVEVDDGELEDPSVNLARAANAAKRLTRNRDASAEMSRPHTRAPDARRSPTPEIEDPSVRLARASVAGQPPKPEEDSNSMAAAKLNLVRHLRDELPDCTSLKVLRQHLTKSLDVIAVAMMQPPEPRRAKGGPREYMMSFTVTDHSIGPHAVAEVLLYRPHKDFLPVVKYGDVVLLRSFTVVSLTGKGFGLRTNDSSSWAVFDHEDQPAQIKGPPVEYGDSETTYVTYLREWFGLLDEKAKEKLERANQKLMEASRPKKN